MKIEGYYDYLKTNPQDCCATSETNEKDYYLKTSIPLHTTTETKEKCELPIILNFYGCAFNFGNKSTAESRYNNGDETYNHNKE